MLVAAACALTNEGFTDMETNSATMTVSGSQYPDGALLGFDAERMQANVQVVSRGRDRSDVRIAFSPGPGVIISDEEKTEYVEDIEGALYRCLYEEPEEVAAPKRSKRSRRSKKVASRRRGR